MSGIIGFILFLFILRGLSYVLNGNIESNSRGTGSTSNSSGDLSNLLMNFLTLSIKLMKADGVVSESEKIHTKNFMVKMFGDKAEALFSGDMIDLFAKESKGNNPTLEVMYLKGIIKEEGWFSIIQFLYALAASDGQISSSEDSFIKTVGNEFGFSEDQIRQIRNLFIAPENNTHKDSPEMISNLGVLGLKPGVSMGEIKSAYRSMAKEFHPDKLASLSEGIQNLGKEKFQDILKAYDYLKSNYREPAKTSN